MSEPTDDGALAANDDFYRALEAGDLVAMEELWALWPGVTCAHPGRAALRGRDEVLASWATIFRAGGNPQVIVTDIIVYRRGPVAWVTATENLLSEGRTGAATALNLFVFDDRWRMVAHHAAPVLT